MTKTKQATGALKEASMPQNTLPKGKLEWRKAWIMRLLVSAGFTALVYYFSWWFKDNRLASPWLALLLLAAVLYASAQIAGNWIVYLFARRPSPPPPCPDGLTVDVFVTACNEAHDLIERSLAAACAMRGEHHTWLLDDGSQASLEAMAKRLGAGYLRRSDHRDAKAGNLNAALPRTHGDVIVIFDVDHVPAPDFLERSLGYFADPQIGFVQVMLTFANGDESWVAQAAIETSLEFYNPTSLGASGLEGATLMGSNALIRRKALESIGGYRPGLAEDLATSIALHAAGWRSAYVAEPLAPGLAPPSFTAWFVQQLKWARGVFELLLTAYPRLFPKLSLGQRLSYAVRMTKYWIGPVVGFHLFATIAILIFGKPAMWLAFHDYLIHITPLALADVAIRHVALRFYRHRAMPRTSLARAVALVYATWPIYLLAWLMAVLRLPLGFQPTPKQADGNLNPVWLLPQMLALVLVAIGALITVSTAGHPLSLLLLFAIVQGVLQLIFLKEWLYSTRPVESRNGRPGRAAPVAVLDLDFHHLPQEITGLEGRQQALALVRLNGRPAGQAMVKVENGRLCGKKLQQAILESAGWDFWETWLHGYLQWEEPGHNGSGYPPATVAVCTRDRAEDLRRCLEAIIRLPDDGQEVIVIDSCSSSDSTRQVVERYPQVRYYREEYPGLNRARNRALQEARHEIVAFVDDDAVPDPDWLRAILRNFKDPRVMCVTGLTMPLELETEAQQWFENFSPFNRGFARKVLDKNALHPLAAGQAGAGANMALRRSLLEKTGPFDEALDAGTPTYSGGDTEMFSRILAGGYQIVYDPAALCWHRHRRTWNELRHTLYGYGVGTYAYWTRKLLVEGEWSVLALAWQWAWQNQIPGLARSLLRRPGSLPVELCLAELRGCLAGPGAYLASQQALTQTYHGSSENSHQTPGKRHYSRA